MRVRKVLGGGMRQVGFMAAAGLYALDNNINRLEELRTIFDAPQRTLEGQFNSFSKRENFRNDEEYNKTMAIINKAISTGTDDLYSSNFVDGVFTIDLRKK